MRKSGVTPWWIRVDELPSPLSFYWPPDARVVPLQSFVWNLQGFLFPFFFSRVEKETRQVVSCVAALFGPHRSHHGRLPVCSNEDEEGGSCVAPANVGLVGWLYEEETRRDWFVWRFTIRDTKQPKINPPLLVSASIDTLFLVTTIFDTAASLGVCA